MVVSSCDWITSAVPARVAVALVPKLRPMIVIVAESAWTSLMTTITGAGVGGGAARTAVAIERASAKANNPEMAPFGFQLLRLVTIVASSSSTAFLRRRIFERGFGAVT